MIITEENLDSCLKIRKVKLRKFFSMKKILQSVSFQRSESKSIGKVQSRRKNTANNLVTN